MFIHIIYHIFRYTYVNKLQMYMHISISFHLFACPKLSSESNAKGQRITSGDPSIFHDASWTNSVISFREVYINVCTIHTSSMFVFFPILSSFNCSVVWKR